MTTDTKLPYPVPADCRTSELADLAQRVQVLEDILFRALGAAEQARVLALATPDEEAPHV